MKTLFLTLSIVFNLVSYSQNKNNINNVKSVSIDIVKVDAKFYSLLDSLLKYDCRCSYYSDTLYYGIWIDKTITDKGNPVIIISIIGNTQKESFLDDDRHRQSLFGYFLYKRHNFFLFGSNILESIIVTNKKKIFQYSDYYPDEDDRWTIYRFLYYNKKYMLYEKENDWLCK